MTVRRARASAGSHRQRSISPASRRVLPAPVTNSWTGSRRSRPSVARSTHTPPRATAIDTIGAAGSARHTLPPTVALFHTLNDEENARQQPAISARAPGQGPSGPSAKASSSATAHVAAISRPPAPTTSGCQPIRSRSHKREIRGWGAENSQVPPASHASPASHRTPPRGSRTARTVTRSIPVRLRRPSNRAAAPYPATVPTPGPPLASRLVRVKATGPPGRARG